MRKLILVAALLSLGACAGAPQFKTQYALNSEGNLVERQVPVANNDNVDLWWKIPLVVGAAFLGAYGLSEMLDDDDPAPAPAAPGPFVLPASGESTSSYSNSYILPDYQVVN